MQKSDGETDKKGEQKLGLMKERKRVKEKTRSQSLRKETKIKQKRDEVRSKIKKESDIWA